METLTGKTLIFTDLHCGLANNKLSRLNICANVIKEIIKAVSNSNVQNIIFGGDWYHSRTMLDVNTINVSLKLVQALAKHVNLYLICGNHDAFLKNSTDVNSLNMFRNTPNVHVIDKVLEINLNSQKCLLVPWLADLSNYQQECFDLAVGHFEISAKYLMQSYIEDNNTKQYATSQQCKNIDNDGLLSDDMKERKSSSLLGNFVDLVKRNGFIYAGHIHKHKEFLAKGRKFFFVGSPYQQTLGEIDSQCGYYILNDKNIPKFYTIDSTPKHVQILMSSILNNKFDFKLISNAIIQKVYDIDIDAKNEAKINQIINDFKPYEELMPDYRVSIDSNNDTKIENSSLELIKKSKVEYMRNYIDNIEPAALAEQNIDKDKLFSVMESYYKKVTEN